MFTFLTVPDLSVFGDMDSDDSDRFREAGSDERIPITVSVDIPQ